MIKVLALRLWFELSFWCAAHAWFEFPFTFIKNKKRIIPIFFFIWKTLKDFIFLYFYLRNYKGCYLLKLLFVKVRKWYNFIKSFYEEYKKCCFRNILVEKLQKSCFRYIFFMNLQISSHFIFFSWIFKSINFNIFLRSHK